MTAPDRIVRKLRLRAGDEEEIGRVLPRLEDALRCASLPDAGGRMLLVRKLALGRIGAHASSQTLSRLIELRMADAGVQWVPGGTAAASDAGFVSFAGGLQARTQLALRLVRGEPCAGWYWPLAVPEFRRAADPAELLRRIAETIAQLPEARTGLPAWAAALVAAGGTAHLVAAIDATLGTALLQQAGIAMRSAANESSRLDRPATPSAPGHSNADRAALASPGENSLPRWLRTLLMAAGYDTHRGPRVSVHEGDADATKAAATALARGWRPEPVDLNKRGSVPTAPPALVAPSSPEADSIGASAPPAHAPAPDAAPTEPGGPDTLPSARAVAPETGPPYLEPTVCAGLLFLLPVLDRLGIDVWSAQAEARGERFAHRVLLAALRRLRVPLADPIWTILATDLHDDDAIEVPAPACWGDSLLTPPRGARSRGSVVEALAQSRSADEQARVWLTAARRWLRRGGGIGLASLAWRPGFASLTPTHADIHFRVNDSDMRVRRLGLDIDPGWLPWFGRVVSFHYEEPLR